MLEECWNEIWRSIPERAEAGACGELLQHASMVDEGDGTMQESHDEKQGTHEEGDGVQGGGHQGG